MVTLTEALNKYLAAKLTKESGNYELDNAKNELDSMYSNLRCDVDSMQYKLERIREILTN